MRLTLLFGFLLAPAFSNAAASAQVLIHEFLAKNVTGIQDEMSDYEDWIELANLGATAVDISGFHLTDDLTNPCFIFKTEHPASLVI